MAMNKKIIALLLCGIMAGSVTTACGKDNDNDGGGSGNAQSQEAEAVEIANYTAPNVGDTIIEMDFRGYGTVKFRLFPEYAAKGSENFQKLAEQGYYDGLTFHRIIKDFMIQGGDPTGTGMGGASFWGDKFDGGTDPHLIHLPGALCYANSGGTDTNGSQFYIVTGESNITAEDLDSYAAYGITFSDQQKEMYTKYGGTPFLDGNYTVFGQVIDGLDIIFKVQYVDTDASDKPLNDVIIDAVRVTTYNGESCKFYPSDYDLYDPQTETKVVNFTEPTADDDIIVMNIKDYGTVKIRLFPDIMPKACENFLELAKEGYYDGLTYHRIINDFMIQGGDPLGTGYGGECIWGDKFDGGTSSSIIHAAGAIAYANSGDSSTDGSQFYIVTGQKYDKDVLENMITQRNLFICDEGKKVYQEQGGTPFLDGLYSVFGQVIDGLDVIFKVQTVETNEDDKPLSDVIIESMTVEKYDGSPCRWYISDYDMTDAPAETEDTTEAEAEEAEETTENTEETEPSEETTETEPTSETAAE